MDLPDKQNHLQTKWNETKVIWMLMGAKHYSIRIVLIFKVNARSSRNYRDGDGVFSFCLSVRSDENSCNSEHSEPRLGLGGGMKWRVKDATEALWEVVTGTETCRVQPAGRRRCNTCPDWCRTIKRVKQHNVHAGGSPRTFSFCVFLVFFYKSTNGGSCRRDRESRTQL